MTRLLIAGASISMACGLGMLTVAVLEAIIMSPTHIVVWDLMKGVCMIAIATYLLFTANIE